MIKFNRYDFDQEWLIGRARTEFLKRQTNKSAKTDTRSIERIFADFVYGHVAEIFLMEKYGFLDDKRKYQDVKTPKPPHYPVAVKVTENEYYIEKQGKYPSCLKRWATEKLTIDARHGEGSWPELLCVFTASRKTFDYEHYGNYKWDKQRTRFIPQSNLDSMFFNA